VIREEGEGKKTLEAMTALAKLLGGRPPTSRSHSPAILFLSSGIAAAAAAAAAVHEGFLPDLGSCVLPPSRDRSWPGLEAHLY